MSKSRKYIIITVIVLLLAVICICLTLHNSKETDNKTENQTEIVLDSEQDENDPGEVHSTGLADENDQTSDSDKTDTDQKNQLEKTTDKQNSLLNGNDNPSDDNVYGFEDVWGDGSETSSGSGNEGNTDTSEDAEDSQDEEILDDGAQDDKNSGFGPLI